MESSDEFIEIKLYDSWNIYEPNQTLILTIIQEFSICDIKKIEISSWSEQWKSQNIESDLVSILYTSYMLFMSYDLEMKYDFLKS